MPHEDLIHPEDVIINEQVKDQLPKYSSTGVPKSHFYRTPNEASDALDRQRLASESKVFDQLYRLINGFNLAERQIRIGMLRQRTGFNSDKTIRKALAGLEAKGIIARSGHPNSPGGEVYRLFSYSGTWVLRYSGTPVKNTEVLNTSLKNK